MRAYDACGMWTHDMQDNSSAKPRLRRLVAAQTSPRGAAQGIQRVRTQLLVR